MSEPTEQDMQMLRDAEPSWMSGGLAGDVTPYYRAETNLNFPTASIAMHEGGGEEAGAGATIPGGDGATVSYRPFEIVDATEDEVSQIRVVPSMAAGFPIPEYVFPVSSSGYVWVGVIRNESSVSNAYITSGATFPGDSDPTYIIPIGAYTLSGGGVTTVNYRYGPVYIAFCRNWFVNPPEYTPMIS